MAMTCPKCADTLHEVDSYERVTLDFCGGCKGIFFDAGEVAMYFELSSDLPQLDGSRAESKPTQLPCPKCGGRFEELRFGAPDPLVVDRCNGCGGVWLDRGEVPRLEALSAKLERPGSRMLRAMREIRAKGYTGF
jgi:Zn-finger nucleic acid-binding protein